MIYTVMIKWNIFACFIFDSFYRFVLRAMRWYDVKANIAPHS